MIPADVTSRMQVLADASLRPVAPAQEISDKLPGLVAGQKVMAEIQSLLPNGTYRALINQRNITLALPFAAKSGDALELVVTESDGKLTLAVVARPEGATGKPAAASTSATLSRAGQLISTLFSPASGAKDGKAALPLNANSPISAAPKNAQDLLPLLKQAITQSGMFYESHQAEWVVGRFTKAALLQEPQGRLSSPAAFSAAAADELASAVPGKAPPAPGTAPAEPRVVVASKGEALATQRLVADTLPGSADAVKAGAAQNAAQIMAPQAHAVVAQQLEALATQNFSWQGQIWPGQDMRWEIDEDAARADQADEMAAKWATRLRLVLPNLGEVDAQIRLQGDQITLALHADSEATRTLLRVSGLALRSQLDGAGLTLASMGVDAVSESSSHGQADQ